MPTESPNECCCRTPQHSFALTLMFLYCSVSTLKPIVGIVCTVIVVVGIVAVVVVGIVVGIVVVVDHIVIARIQQFPYW